MCFPKCEICWCLKSCPPLCTVLSCYIEMYTVLHMHNAQNPNRFYATCCENMIWPCRVLFVMPHSQRIEPVTLDPYLMTLRFSLSNISTRCIAFAISFLHNEIPDSNPATCAMRIVMKVHLRFNDYSS